MNTRPGPTALAAAVAAVVAAATPSCSGGGDERFVPEVTDPALTPTMATGNVSTFVSDSGYVKYHAVTPLWEMYEETDDPYWRFPQGLELETFRPVMQPNATIRCDSAVYWEQRRLFRLDGNVVCINTDRDTFLTRQLYWDQARTLFYTDSFIHIARQDRVIEGMGFTSNEDMTRYSITLPTALMPASSLRPGQDRTDNNAAADTGTDTDSLDYSNVNSNGHPVPVRSSLRRPSAMPPKTSGTATSPATPLTTVTRQH